MEGQDGAALVLHGLEGLSAADVGSMTPSALTRSTHNSYEWIDVRLVWSRRAVPMLLNGELQNETATGGIEWRGDALVLVRLLLVYKPLFCPSSTCSLHHALTPNSQSTSVKQTLLQTNHLQLLQSTS
jgi:hypothetical protein